MTWESMPLGEFVTLKRGYDLPSSLRVDGPIPVVSSSGVTGCHDAAKVKGPGVVTGRYGTLGEVFFINEDFWPLNTALYVQHFQGNDPRFSAYFLESILTNTDSNKAAVPGVNRNDLHALTVLATRDLGEQKAIASVLRAYDDLIANNQRRIRLLEQAARLLYEEWFVRFRFPGHARVPLTDGIPEGWRRACLSELVTTQYGFTESATDRPVGPKFLRGKDINKTSYIDWSTVPYCSERGLDFDKYALKTDDIVVVRMADPGKAAIIESEQVAVFASYLVRLSRRVEVNITPLYLFFVLSDAGYQRFVSRASGGSTRKSASAKLLVNFSVLVPSSQIMTRFAQLARPLRQQIQKLLQQNAKLRQARHLLLPRLMNREIAV